VGGDVPAPAPAGQYLARRRNHLGSIKKDLGDLQGWRSLIAELIQNADDASDATEMSFTIDDDTLTVWNDGTFSKCDQLDAQACPWQLRGEPACDFHSFSDVAGGAKEARDDATGAFGIGFTAVYQVTDLPVLTSAGKRWTIDETRPEESRVYSEDVADQGGTVFVLPWARELSYMRRELEQPVVTADSIRELTDELFSSVPESMLFLRRLTRIRVCTQTRTVSFRRSRSDRTIEVGSSDGKVERWHVLEGSLANRAEELRTEYPNELRRPRSPSFSVAVSLTGGPSLGRFFATLPTDESTWLPVSLQGSFFPKPDRKRIRLDNAPKDDWNRAIIEEAAAVLAASLEEIRDAAGDDALVTLLAAALELSRRELAGEVDPSFGSWWDCLANTLPTANVVPTVLGEYRSPRTALLWGGHDSEAIAGAVLAELGLDLVASEVRAPWFAFRESIGIRQLSLEHLVSALARAESDVAGGWASGCSPDSLASLWGVLEHLVSTQGRSTAESRDALLALRIFPLIDGTFSDAVTARAAIPGTTKLLGDARVDAPLLDSRRLRESPKLVELIEEVSPADMVEWVHRAFDAGSIPSDLDRGRLLDWFTNRDDAVLASIPDGLRSLPIFPTGTGYESLGALALPVEGFKDPLDLADVLHLEGRPAATRAFLEGLGARELTLDHYCTEFVARAVQLGINDAQMRALLRFLATELSRVQDDADVRDALADLELVTCTDRERRRGAEVYFAGVDDLLVGADRPIAAPPASPAVRRLCEWLGVSSTARSADVIQHGRTLRSAPSNLRETATAVLRHLADQDETAWERDFTLLQGLLWLPVQNDRTRAASPSSVHTIFQQNLFRSQADFLDIGQRDQVQCRVVLTWLGVETEPTVEQAVGHLLYCRDADTPVKDDMWDFLARHVEDPVLDRLRGEPCVLLGNGSYVIAAHCFWSENPFGRHRHHLGERFRKWSDLFERLGVRERPDAADAVDVLQSIAAAHGGADEPLLAADVEVVDSCWVFLDRLVRDDGLGSEDVADLASTECVLAADRTLQRPCDVLFRDSSAISAEFDEEARRFLISRPENASHALEAAGVRHLRDALTTSVVERIDAEGRSLLEERFDDRRLLVLRVLAAGDDAASTKVAQFTQSIDIVPLHQLTVVERIEVAGRPFESSPFDRIALFRAAASEMLVAEGEPGDRRWDEIATEVAFALGIDPDDVPNTAMSLKVVLEADTSEAVVRVLDAMRFPPLDEAIHIDLTDEVMDTFADEESVDGASDQDSQEPGDDVAERESPEPHDEPVERDGPTPAPPTGEEATGKAEESKGGGSGGSAEPSTDGKAKEEGAPPGAHPNGGLKSGQQGKKRESYKQRERDQLRSYLQSEGETASTRERDGLSDEQRRKVDAAAVDAVVAYEERVGRAPERMPHENEGFDVRSTAADGSVRYIEVKGTSPQWDRQGVALSSRQFQEARTRGDEFWLYVVEVGKPGADPIRIQDPANRVRQYFLDSGWRIADEERERIVRTLPELVIHAEPPGDGAVRLIDWCDGVTQLGWIEVDIEQPPPDAYALQIAGDALGLALRGGAVVTSPGEPEEHDWVVVRLADQLDPDTGAPVCIRQWVPERDFAGMLLGVRLQSDGSIPPITIEDPSTVQILGIVSHQLRVDDLSTVVSADG
jgi:hypothetical protein